MPHWSHPSIYSSRIAAKRSTYRPRVTGTTPEAVTGELFREALAQFSAPAPGVVRPAPPATRHTRRRTATVAVTPGLRTLHLDALRSLLWMLRRAVRQASARLTSVVPARRRAVLTTFALLALLVPAGALAQVPVAPSDIACHGAPVIPGTLRQSHSTGTSLATGATISEGSPTTVRIDAVMNSGCPGYPGYLEVEIQPVGTSFTSVPNVFGAAATYNGNGTPFATVVISGLTPGTAYRWQARSRQDYSGWAYYSGWASFNGGSTAFTTGSTVPATPTLTAPADAATAVSRTPAFSWSDGGAGVTYDLLIETDGGSTTTLVKTGLSTPSYTLSGAGAELLNNGQAYSWRVRASNTGGSSAYANSRTFTVVIAAPDVPVVVGPADGATDQTLTPTLDWDAAARAASYVVTIALSGAAPGDYVDVGVVNGGATEYTVPAGKLALGNTYTWRVKAINADNVDGLYSAERTFTVPAVPVVVTNAASLVASTTATVNGTVNPGGGTTTYAYRYGTDAELDAGTEGTAPTPAGSAGTGTSAADVPVNLTGLASGTTHYFQLTAANVSGSAAGSILSFITDVAGATGLAPGGTVSIEPTLDWNDVVGGVSYVVEIDDDANLGVDAADTTPPRTRSAGATSRYVVDFDDLPLDNSRTYYWRVATTGTNGVVVNSGVAAFTTTPPTILPQANYPTPAAVIADPRNLRFSWSPFTRNTNYTYRLQVDEVPDGGVPDWADLVVDVDNGLAIQYTTSVLAGSKTYAWRVITYAASLGDSSPLAGTTMTYTAPVTFSTRTGHVMAIPAYPTAGVTVYTPTPTLSWYLATQATGLTYDVEFINQTDGESFTGTPDFPGLTALTHTTAALDGGKTYAWKVRTCVAGTATCSDWSSAATFVVNGTAPAGAPAPPTLSYPTNGLTLYGSTARLSWTSAGAGLTYVAYTFECATATCTDAPAITDANTGYTPSAVLDARRYDLAVTPGRSYAWYVRSRNSGGTFSAATARWTFAVGTAVGTTTAVPSYPTSGATVYTLTPALSWYLSGSATGITGYDVRWGTSSDPNTFAGSGSTSGVNSRTFTIPSGLSYGATYYWHVRVAGTASWATASFVTTGSTGSVVPVASWPTGGATVWAAAQSLNWYLNGSSAGITAYEGELTRVGGATTTFPATTRSYTATGLVGGASYTWRVRACAGTTCGAYSTAAMFTVHSSVGGGGAPMPFAESPAAGVVITGSAPPVLSWSLPVEGLSALTYEVEVSRSADMASPQRFERLTSPQVALGRLAAGTHYWRVRSRDAEGRTSGYSPVETFTTNTSVAIEEMAQIPHDYTLESVYPNPLARQGTVRFGLPEASHVQVTLYDAVGREVARLVDGDLAAGVHRFPLEASGLPSGLYLVRMTAGRFTATRPLIVHR
jgi:hypothetical protein